MAIYTRTRSINTSLIQEEEEEEGRRKRRRRKVEQEEEVEEGGGEGEEKKNNNLIPPSRFVPGKLLICITIINNITHYRFIVMSFYTSFPDGFCPHI